MKNKKKILFMSLSVLIICSLINTSSLNSSSAKALIEEKQNQYKTTLYWTTTEIVSTESTSPSQLPSLAVDTSGNVHIAWQDETNYASSGGDYDVFYKRWEFSISSWTTTEVVSTESTGYSFNPSLAVDTAGNVHVVWYDSTNYAGSGGDNDIFYKRWDASNSSWTVSKVVSTESTLASRNPSLTVDSAGNVYVAWEDDTNYAGSGTDRDIFYKHWNASTSSWTTTEVVSTESTNFCYRPSLAVDSAGNVHVGWEDSTNYAGSGTDRDIFYKRWEVSTSSWTTTEVVSTESGGSSFYLSLAVDSAGNSHIAWEDSSNIAGAGSDYDIFYKRWINSSSSWTTTEVVSSESTGYSNNPSLVVDTSGNIHIGWDDDTNYAGSGTDRDIFYKRWDASNSSWTVSKVVSTESTDESFKPSLAVDSAGNVYVAWDNYYDIPVPPTDSDIFYKKAMVPSLPTSPELAFIVPNPTDQTIVYLDWNDVFSATIYYVYRSSSYIWSEEVLVPISTVSSSDYIDTLPSEGLYYYVVVAENDVGNGSRSNCQYVEVKFSELEAPELAPILPNPTDLTSISLVWDSVEGATEYYIYRSASYIWSVEGLTPITTVGSNSYVDSLSSEGYYFYVIVANDGVRNSTHSNCEFIEYKLPSLNEFVIVSSLILGTFVFLFVIMRTRKKNSKPN